MVAIVSGNSLGLNLTSKGVAGEAGVQGDASTGRGGEQVYVNASTGNLVIQQVQDGLAAAGLDVDSVLTYNSRGLLDDDNGDGFSLGKAATQLKLAGTAGAAGSTVTRTEFDGAQQVFTWDAAHGRYVCADGTGAFDTVTLSGSTYTSAHGTVETLATHFDPNGHATGTTVISDISETENQSGGVTGSTNIVAPNTDTLMTPMARFSAKSAGPAATRSKRCATQSPTAMTSASMAPR